MSNKLLRYQELELQLLERYQNYVRAIKETNLNRGKLLSSELQYTLCKLDDEFISDIKDLTKQTKEVFFKE